MKKHFSFHISFIIVCLTISSTHVISTNYYSTLYNQDSIISKSGFELFGSYLFKNNNITFEPDINIQTPNEYIIGIGDEILISIWGDSQFYFQLTVNPNGQIIIPRIGPLFIAGLEFQLASKKITNRLSEIYTDLTSENSRTFVSVDIGKLHSIQVTILGEVNAPGTYTLPATTTAFNALYLCGGPNTAGSFRNITLVRNNKAFLTIDLYKLLLTGEESENVPLRNGDVIFVPLAQKTVSASGEFKRNYRFELTEGEALEDLIYYAGGFTAKGYTPLLKIYRKTQKGVTVLDITLDKAGNTVVINDDSIVALRISGDTKNRVTISGAVFRPGEYQIQGQTELLDIIMRADSLHPDAYLNKGVIIRENPDKKKHILDFDLYDVLNGKSKILLIPQDSIIIKSHFTLKEPLYVTIQGWVISPGIQKYFDGMTLGDAIFMANGFLEGADTNSIQVARRLTNKEKSRLSDTLLHVFILKTWRDPQANANAGAFNLRPFDQINVKQAPGFRNEGTVEISGEVFNPGPYAIISREMRISDLVVASGGLKPSKNELVAFLTKTSQNGNENISINIQNILSDPGSKQDLILTPGDNLTVCKVPPIVRIGGEVQNPLTQTYVSGKNARYYINNAGGFTNSANPRYVYIKYADGLSAKTRGFLFFNVFPQVKPGCEIIVPTQQKETRDVEKSAVVVSGSEQ